jgi:hypothetical protein
VNLAVKATDEGCMSPDDREIGEESMRSTRARTDGPGESTRGQPSGRRGK